MLNKCRCVNTVAPGAQTVPRHGPTAPARADVLLSLAGTRSYDLSIMNIDDTTPPAPFDHADAQRILVRALQEPERYANRVTKVTLIETHISCVLLTGRLAYKIKKPVNFGFVDFSTLEQRRRCCLDELRLNRRLAPELYLAVVAIRGTPDNPRLDSTDHDPDGGPVIEYAVKMREFPQSQLFDRRLARGVLHVEQIDELAGRIAQFHGQAARTPPTAALGSPDEIWRLAAENFAPESAADAVLEAPVLRQLADWSRAHYARLEPFLAQRRADGFVRECHGDLHLGNVALVDGKPLAFDGIEFNPALRWIDVMNEVAFLSMDLDERGRPDLAWRFINRYLEHTGDYAGLPGLIFYRVYRALVRAKVAGLRAAQEDSPTAARERETRAQYLTFAVRASAPQQAQLLLMHGVSGSGKSWTAQALAEHLGAVRLRSDIERKRLHGLPPLARSHSATNAGLYAGSSTGATYRRLARLAREVLLAGLPAVVDATCLKAWQRELFRALADELGIPWRIVSCHADQATLRQRLIAREAGGGDASEADLAILHQQLQTIDPLSADERRAAIVFDSARQPLTELFARCALKAP